MKRTKKRSVSELLTAIAAAQRRIRRLRAELEEAQREAEAADRAAWEAAARRRLQADHEAGRLEEVPQNQGDKQTS